MPEVLTQSVATPRQVRRLGSAAIAFIYAGNGAWLTFVIATISMVLIGYSVSIFARRFASAGSFYVFNTKASVRQAALPRAGADVGLCLYRHGHDLWRGDLPRRLLDPDRTAWRNHRRHLLMIAIDVAVASWFAYRSIGLSARVSLVLEAVR